MTETKKANIIKADYGLQNKIGTGPLDPETVKKCQSVIDNNNVDFSPIALEILEGLEKAIASAKSPGTPTRDGIQGMAQTVMQLKANAATFRYTLIGNLANVMLSFLESVKTLDADVIQICEAHHKTLKAIIVKRLQGDGGIYGKQLEEELKSACKRYLSKKK